LVFVLGEGLLVGDGLIVAWPETVPIMTGSIHVPRIVPSVPDAVSVPSIVTA